MFESCESSLPPLPCELPSMPISHLGIQLKLFTDTRTSGCHAEFELGGRSISLQEHTWLDALSSAQSQIEQHLSQVAFVFYDTQSKLFAGGQPIPHLSNMAFSDIDDRVDQYFDRRDDSLCYFRERVHLLKEQDLPALLLRDDFLLDLCNELLPGTFVLRHEPTLFDKIQLLPEYSSSVYTPEAIRAMLSERITQFSDPAAEMMSLLNRFDAMADHRPSAYPGWFWKFPLL